MKLTKTININVYQVLADYKVKIENSPFISILKFAEENLGETTPEMLHEEFLHPLSKKACENLLDRLTDMGYFQKTHSNNKEKIFQSFFEESIYDYLETTSYQLTELGKQAAQRKEFYENRRGILKIYVDPSQKIVKIKELREDSSNEDNSRIKNIDNTELIKLQDPQKVISLAHGSFILSKFDNKYRVLKPEKAQLELNATEKFTRIRILDYELTNRDTEKIITNKLLKNEFGEDYNQLSSIVFADYDKNNLELKRSIEIKKPKVYDTIFDKVKLQNIKVSPKNLMDAKKWYKDLLIKRINRYFLSDQDFNDYADSIATEFELYNEDLKRSISRKELIKELDGEQDFYKKAKLETIDYLNY